MICPQIYFDHLLILTKAQGRYKGFLHSNNAMTERSQENDLRVIAYRRAQVIDMIATAASGRTMMPKRQADERLHGIIYSYRALQWLDELEAIARFPSLKYAQHAKIPKPTGVTLVDRVARRTQREKRYESYAQAKTYEKDEDFIV
jgi:hypothetical protein